MTSGIGRAAALMRLRVQALLTDTCVIERETAGVGTMGEPLHQWGVVVADVPCRVITGARRSGAGYQNIGSTESMIERFRLITPVGTPFAVDDRVQLSDGTVYQVVEVVDQLTDAVDTQAIIVRAR
jgi:hypothetical protein